MRHRPPSGADLKRQVDHWNVQHAPGTKVIVRKVDGSLVSTKTMGEAYVLSGHSAVVHLENISGCYLLKHVSADVSVSVDEVRG